MTREMPWYKRYPADFIAGVSGMDAEEIGIYAVVLDLLYDRGKPIPNDPRWLGSMINRSTRKAGRLIASLIERDKLFELDDCLSNMRAEIEMAKALKARNRHMEAGSKGGRARVRNYLENRQKFGR